MMGTAPRRPTQLMNSLALGLIFLNGRSEIKTLNGLATRMAVLSLLREYRENNL